jgi:hypothetical protein
MVVDKTGMEPFNNCFCNNSLDTALYSAYNVNSELKYACFVHGVLVSMDSVPQGLILLTNAFEADG